MNDINLIGISGKAGSGKDTIAAIIQYVTSPCSDEEGETYRTFQQYLENRDRHPSLPDSWYMSEWENKKFSGKLKQMAAIALGVPVERFEDREFKEKHRNLLIYIGNTMRKYDPDFWINALFKDYFEHPVRCNNCDWEGEEEDLALIECDNNDITEKPTAIEYVDGKVHRYSPMPENRNFFKGCPKCETDGFLKDTNENMWIISDVRYPNEAEAIKSRGGVVIRVNRIYDNPLIMDAHTDRQDISETALDDYTGFYTTIENSGTIPDLSSTVKGLMKELKIIL